MRSVLYSILLVFITTFFFSCEKKSIPIDTPIIIEQCEYEKLKNDIKLRNFNDSFYFSGLKDGLSWKPTDYIFRVKGVNDHCGNTVLTVSYVIGEEMPFCSYAVTGLSSSCYIYSPKDTLILNKSNNSLTLGFLIRYEVKNNKLWDRHTIAIEDSLSKNNYLFIQGFNADTSIIWGAFQLKLVGGTKSPDFVVKDGKFRVQVTK